jgi:hypothetical protein
VADRCTGSQRNAAGEVVSVAPGSDQAQAVSLVALPLGRALALTAVTSEPAGAASRPLLVPTGPGTC